MPLSWIHELLKHNLILHPKGVYPNYMQPCDTQNSITSLFTGICTVNQNCIDVVAGAKVNIITIGVYVCFYRKSFKLL